MVSESYAEYLYRTKGPDAERQYREKFGDAEEYLDALHDCRERIADIEQHIVDYRDAYQELRGAAITFMRACATDGVTNAQSAQAAYDALLDVLYPSDATVTFADAENDQ